MTSEQKRITDQRAVSEEAPALEVVRIVAPFVIMAVGGLGLWFFWKHREVPERPLLEKEMPLVDTRTVVPFNDPLTIEVDGHVVPYLEVVLSAEVAGRVEKKADNCLAGKFVKKGDPLIVIDPKDYELEKKRSDRRLWTSPIMRSAAVLRRGPGMVRAS